MVYDILTQSKLGQYYKIKRKSEFFSPAKPVEIKKNRFDYLDDPAMREKYAYGHSKRTMKFYVEGVHCVACLWLMEHLPSLVPGVSGAEMEFGTMTLKVTICPDGAFAQVAQMLAQLGYEPHPLATDEDALKLREAEDKKQLLQVGIAGFCAANMMFVFICIYAGISGFLLSAFRYFSFALFIPVFTYCAQPFYRSAWAAIQSKQINIDVPVTAAILLGTAAGFYNLLSGSPHIYFDSLSVFVFLLLGTRFFLKKLHQKFSNKTDFSEFLIPSFVMRVVKKGGDLERVAIERLQKGDVIQIAADEVLSVDGEVVQGESYLDCHMMNGESLPVLVKPGSQVFAGTVNQGLAFQVVVHEVGEATRLAKMIQKINATEKPRVVELADRLAKWYLWIIFALTSAVLAWFTPTNFPEGLNRALSLIIVACPCALALATPLAYTLGLRLATKLGVLLKGPAVLEKLARAKTLFLDKTGTLTMGQFDVLDWQSVEEDNAFYFDVVYALEEKSRHPIALAIRRYLLEQNSFDRVLEIQSFEEKMGKGVAGNIKNHFYEIKSVGAESLAKSTPENKIETVVGLFEDGVCKVRIFLGDAIRKSSYNALQRLQTQFESIQLVSGDREQAVEAVAGELGIASFHSGMSPEEKQLLVQKSARSFMIGDGANDALALSSAYVSAAVQGSLDISFRSADSYFLRPGIEPLAPLICAAKKTKQTIYRNLSISLFYNVIGVALALGGWVTPLVAAVVMPLSSLSVLLSSVAGLRNPKEVVT